MWSSQCFLLVPQSSYSHLDKISQCSCQQTEMLLLRILQLSADHSDVQQHPDLELVLQSAVRISRNYGKQHHLSFPFTCRKIAGYAWQDNFTFCTCCSFYFSVIVSCDSVALKSNQAVFWPQNLLRAPHHAEVFQGKRQQRACVVLSRLIFKWLTVHTFAFTILFQKYLRFILIILPS